MESSIIDQPPAMESPGSVSSPSTPKQPAVVPAAPAMDPPGLNKRIQSVQRAQRGFSNRRRNDQNERWAKLFRSPAAGRDLEAAESSREPSVLMVEEPSVQAMDMVPHSLSQEHDAPEPVSPLAPEPAQSRPEDGPWDDRCAPSEPEPELAREDAQTRSEHGPWDGQPAPTAPEPDTDPARPRVRLPTPTPGLDTTTAASPPVLAVLRQLADDATLLVSLATQTPHAMASADWGRIAAAAAVLTRLRRAAVRSRGDDSTCIICCARSADAVFMPCRHLVVCVVGLLWRGVRGRRADVFA